MTYRLENATKGWAGQIAMIWETGWHDAHADIVPTRLRALRTKDSFLVRTMENLLDTQIAVDGSKLLGFCMTKEDELYQMYVSQQARGSGVAQALIKDAESRIKAAGHKMAWLACAMGNERASRFYEKTGWVKAGRQVVSLDTSEGAFPLEVWRFEKQMATGLDE